MQQISIVGKTTKTTDMSQFVIMYCFGNRVIDERNMHFFYRLLINNSVIDRIHYNRKKKTKSCVVKYICNDKMHVGAKIFCPDQNTMSWNLLIVT